MNAETINPFIESVTEVFDNMLECQLSTGDLRVAQSQPGGPDVIGMIGLSGTAKAIVALRVPVKTALAVVGKMVGTTFKSVDASIIDGIAELVNIVAGNAKSKFEGHSLSLSLPSVVRGDICRLSSQSDAQWLEVPFECDLGSFSLVVSMKIESVADKKEARHESVNSR